MKKWGEVKMNITDRARDYILDIMNEQGLNTVRVVFAGMGWGGPKLGLALDEPAETDKKDTINGVNVAIESNVVDHIATVTLDYHETGLVIVGNDDCC